MLGPIGMPELVVVLVLVLIVFGAGRLPEVMGSLGKGVREFRKASTTTLDEPSPDTKAVASEAKPEEKG